MQDKGKPQPPDQAAGRSERDARLAQALRDNLRRRKEQARAKAGTPVSESGDKPPKSEGGG
ncbi:hypothetical protein [Reyranella sp. CPCC 100927]|uniref:hypothetical protein n=1 Tax=Reyranella sp. CPCC 100927 TaxID=2599616 RepID=UPI0011B7E598|nr:hypothetical protein [Reyranella sp. CPCC 100927]TWS97588.1 hypothetical protein FQU96_37290 [Reyranella sp. CPCC 100927]